MRSFLDFFKEILKKVLTKTYLQRIIESSRGQQNKENAGCEKLALTPAGKKIRPDKMLNHTTSNNSGRACKTVYFGKDMYMTDYEIIMIVLAIMGLLVSMDNHRR